MRKFTSLTLALLMVTMLFMGACSNQSGSSSGGGGNADVPTLIWFMGDPGTIPPDQAKVEERLNEISVEKAGVKMKTIYYNDENIKISMTAGDPWDIAFTCEWYNNYAVQALAGYFADITDKVKTVTPALYATMPDVVWEGAKINGKVMAVPTKKDYAAELFFMFDRDLFVDSLKMNIPDRMSFFDVETYLKAAKDAIGEGNSAAKAAYPLMLAKGGIGGTTSMYDMINHDAMMGIPYAAMGTATENKVVFILEDKAMVDRLTALHKWFELGYINPDAAQLDTDPQVFELRTGQGFYGADAIWSGNYGYPIAISKFDGPYLSTASIRGSMNAINAKSKNIDLTLKYLELVNTNQEYRDILRYGIEGEHWNKTSEGLAQKTDQGRNGYSCWAFSQGSYSLSSVEAAEGVTVDPHMWDVVFAGYKDLKSTNSIGFAFDPQKVEIQISATQAVKQKYWEGLITGTLDPATVLPTFIKEMEDAGVRQILAECQAQYDAFISNK